MCGLEGEQEGRVYISLFTLQEYEVQDQVLTRGGLEGGRDRYKCVLSLQRRTVSISRVSTVREWSLRPTETLVHSCLVRYWAVRGNKQNLRTERTGGPVYVIRLNV